MVQCSWKICFSFQRKEFTMELYGVRYAKNFKYATWEAIYKDNVIKKETQEFIFLYYIAKYNGKTILIDTGFRDKKTASDMGITLLDIESEVQDILKDSKNIDVIFITHSHFDHINNLDLYAKASIIISKAEYDIAMKESPKSVRNTLSIANVKLIEDEYTLDGKLRFKVIGGHSLGSSVIYFDEGEKNYVITGDECYIRDNISKNIPVGFFVDTQKNERFIKDSYIKGIIPLCFHDVTMFDDYPQVSENIIKIV